MRHTLSRGETFIECPFCGNPVAAAALKEHLVADARLLKIIETTHPAWGCDEWQDYFRALSGNNGTNGRSREVS